MRVYHWRLRSNLLHELRQLIPAKADIVAEGIASIIDGAYVRWALQSGTDRPDRPEVVALEYLDLNLSMEPRA